MSYSLSSKRWYLTVWGSRDLASGANAGQSRISLPHYLRIAIFQAFCQVMAVKFCRLSFPKSLRWLASPPDRFLTFYVWLGAD
jgi:hypothetical protein